MVLRSLLRISVSRIREEEGSRMRNGAGKTLDEMDKGRGKGGRGRR